MEVERKTEETQQQEKKLPEQLSDSEIPQQANNLLLWMARFPIQRIHPRPTSAVSESSKSGEVMVCKLDEKVTDVFRKLILEGFLSCPVINDKNEYQGFVDLLILTSHTLQLFSEWREKQGENKEQSVSKTQFWELSEFTSLRIMDILEKPHWKSKNPPYPLIRGFSLLYAVELMARMGVHRVPILDPGTKEVKGILTQSMCISLLDQELDQFGPLKNIQVKEMTSGLLSRIHAFEDNTIAEIAFKEMVNKNVSGFPVVNGQGELVDTISVRDLRGIGPPPGTNNFDLLFQPISSFKSKCREIFKTQTPETPIFVTEKDTFEKLIHNFYDGNIHRVFVCELNDNGKPIPKHVVSQRDVLRFLIWRLGMAPALVPTSAI